MKIQLIHIIVFSVVAWCASCNLQEAVPDAESQALQPKQLSSQAKMVLIPGGAYKPFYGSDTALVKVNPFLIDERPVTNGEFLAFVKAHLQWQRSQVKRLYADTNYLHDWVGDTVLPEGINIDAPVTQLSWYAAKAYATAVGKRLPLLDEWELVAMADETVPNAREKKSYSDKIIDLYLVKNRQYNAVSQSPPNYWGVYNFFDLVWEWTDDFNSVLVTGDARSGEYSDNNLFCAGSATSATDVLNYAAFMRFSMRAGLKAHYTVANLGFRCAKDVDDKPLLTSPEGRDLASTGE
ncbi:MAG: formylglycine-generating enzyme family protein [Chitinophagaceae bacterium]|nr:formylglycine-generating enzyme family protein [Chitinophagaceae bacterium]MCW5926649.1 formylglycine-generating enzyme family protein [Chitinophagaceae bacterium]